MFNTNLLVGVPIVLTATLTFLNTAVPEQGPPPFLIVHDMYVEGDQVTAERTIPAPAGIADWSVVVVGRDVDAPSCQTKTGDKEHEGWSRYKPSSRASRAMHLDVWVGYEGCYDKLTPGAYDMFVTWTPRDGLPVVSARTSFSKP